MFEVIKGGKSATKEQEDHQKQMMSLAAFEDFARKAIEIENSSTRKRATIKEQENVGCHESSNSGNLRVSGLSALKVKS